MPKKSAEEKSSNPLFSNLFHQLTIIAIAVVIVLIAVNLVTPKSDFEKLKEGTMNGNKISTEKLFSLLLINNQFADASKIAIDTKDAKLITLADEKLHAKQFALTGLTLWLKISTLFPNFRDALIKSAIFALQLDKNSLATNQLQKASQIDPNNQTIKGLSSH